MLWRLFYKNSKPWTKHNKNRRLLRGCCGGHFCHLYHGPDQQIRKHRCRFFLIFFCFSNCDFCHLFHGPDERMRKHRYPVFFLKWGIFVLLPVPPQCPSLIVSMGQTNRFSCLSVSVSVSLSLSLPRSLPTPPSLSLFLSLSLSLSPSLALSLSRALCLCLSLKVLN